MAIISKGELMLALGDDLDTLTAFLFSTNGAALKWQLEQASGFDLDSPVIQKKLGALAAAGIVRQETIDSLLAGNVQKNVESAVLRKFDISVVAGNLREWIAENIEPKGTTFELVGDVVVTTGTLPLKEIA